MELEQNRRSRLEIITGERGVGKSTYCLHKVIEARHAGRKVAGLLSIAKFRQGEKVGIEVEDLSKGERRLLASAIPGSSDDLRLGPWFFDNRTIEWGNKVLERTPSCDLLVVDELGILEFDRSQGFISAFDILDKGEFLLAMVVIRPEYLDRALDRWPWAEIIRIE